VAFLWCISDWLSSHTAAVQAAAAIMSIFLTAVLVVTTILYLQTTNRILEESRKSREAAEKQARAAQENLTLLKQEYESRLGEGPQIVRHAIKAGLESISAWIGQTLLGIHRPERVAAPADLVPDELTAAMEHARRISSECADQISSAIGQMRIAKTHIQTLRQSVHGPRGIPTQGGTPPPVAMLERAREHLQNALKAVPGGPTKER